MASFLSLEVTQILDAYALDNTDSDGDTLKYWQERLLGTNPYSADTDGDGDGIRDHLDPDPRTRSGTAPGSTLKVYTQLR